MKDLHRKGKNLDMKSLKTHTQKNNSKNHILVLCHLANTYIIETRFLPPPPKKNINLNIKVTCKMF